jgi:hypothetical protein
MRIFGAAATLPYAPWVYFDPAKCMTSRADHGWLMTAERPETTGFYPYGGDQGASGNDGDGAGGAIWFT